MNRCPGGKPDLRLRVQFSYQPIETHLLIFNRIISANPLLVTNQSAILLQRKWHCNETGFDGIHYPVTTHYAHYILLPNTNPRYNAVSLACDL